MKQSRPLWFQLSFFILPHRGTTVRLPTRGVSRPGVATSAEPAANFSRTTCQSSSKMTREEPGAAGGATGPVTIKLNQIIPWGRSFQEYRRMFTLTDEDLRGSILGCADGPASFNAEATDRAGGR